LTHLAAKKRLEHPEKAASVSTDDLAVPGRLPEQAG
jgi:hypothetical protein